MGRSVPNHALQPAPADPGPGDGDELQFCSTCAFGAVCLPAGYTKADLSELHYLVEHTGPVRAGARIFTTNDRFESIYAVRAGIVKTRTIDAQGREQVLGFHLPGEFIGLSAIHPARYPCDAIALDTVYLCRFSFPALSTLAAKMPAVQQELFRLISADINKVIVLTGDHSADERLAAFLLRLSERFASRGFSATRFRLGMPRADIANHLRLAPETISRVLRRFQDDDLVRVDERDVELCSPERLRAVAAALLPSSPVRGLRPA